MLTSEILNDIANASELTRDAVVRIVKKRDEFLKIGEEDQDKMGAAIYDAVRDEIKALLGCDLKSPSLIGGIEILCKAGNEIRERIDTIFSIKNSLVEPDED